jgi:hypothetical protein
MAKKTLDMKIASAVVNTDLSNTDEWNRMIGRLRSLFRVEQKRKCSNCTNETKKFLQKLSEIER